MGGIDFLSQPDKKRANDKAPSSERDVQYTEGEALRNRADKAVYLSNDASGDKAPKQKTGFLSWRHKKDDDPLSALTAKVVAGKHVSPAPMMKRPSRSSLAPLPQQSSTTKEIQKEIATRPVAQPMPPTTIASAESVFSEGSRANNEDRAQVNLLPRDVVNHPFAQHHARQLVLVALVCAVFIALVDIGFALYQRRIHADTSSVEDDITRLDRQIKSYQAMETSARGVSNHLGALQDIVSEHIYWTPLFQLLEERTLENVYYERMLGTAATGFFTFEAVAPNFRTIETQVHALRASSYVKSVAVHTASETEKQTTIAEGETPVLPAEQISFRMDVEFQPSLFKKVLP